MRRPRLFPALISTEEGVTQQELADRLGMEVGTVSRLLDKLVHYGYVLRSVPEDNAGPDKRRTLQNNRGSRYVLCDFFLHFYFSVMQPMDHQIRANASGLLFPSQILQGEAKEYIPAFTGKAFERFVYHHVDVALRVGEWEGVAAADPRPVLWRLLDLPDAADIEDVLAKVLPKRFEGYARRNFLVASYEPTRQLSEMAALENVTIITLEAFL